MDRALDAIEGHARAINARDLDAYRKTMSYPFTYQNHDGVALTIERPEECGAGAAPPWAIILRTHPHWSHSEFDPAEPVARSDSSAVFKVSFRRIDSAGRVSPTYDAIWIATCRDGTWGVQFRHNLGARG